MLEIVMSLRIFKRIYNTVNLSSYISTPYFSNKSLAVKFLVLWLKQWFGDLAKVSPNSSFGKVHPF